MHALLRAMAASILRAAPGAGGALFCADAMATSAYSELRRARAGRARGAAAGGKRAARARAAGAGACVLRGSPCFDWCSVHEIRGGRGAPGAGARGRGAGANPAPGSGWSWRWAGSTRGRWGGRSWWAAALALALAGVHRWRGVCWNEEAELAELELREMGSIRRLFMSMRSCVLSCVVLRTCDSSASFRSEFHKCDQMSKRLVINYFSTVY